MAHSRPPGRLQAPPLVACLLSRQGALPLGRRHPPGPARHPVDPGPSATPAVTARLTLWVVPPTIPARSNSHAQTHARSGVRSAYHDPPRGPCDGRAVGPLAASPGRETPREQQARYLSREGLAKLRDELDELVNVRRAEVAARIQEAKEHGDISENAEYEDAKNEQAFVEGRIQSLSALIKNAVIIDEHHSTDRPDRLHGGARGPTARRRTPSSVRPRPPRARAHLQRVAGRACPPGQEEGRQGDHLGARRGLRVHRRQPIR